MIGRNKPSITIRDFLDKEKLKQSFNVEFDEYTEWVHDSVCDLLFMYINYSWNYMDYQHFSINPNVCFQTDDEGLHFQFKDKRWSYSMLFYRKALNAIESMMKIYIKQVGCPMQLIDEVQYTGFYVIYNPPCIPIKYAFYNKSVREIMYSDGRCERDAIMRYAAIGANDYSPIRNELRCYFEDLNPFISFTIKNEVLEYALMHKLHIQGYHLHGVPLHFYTADGIQI